MSDPRHNRLIRLIRGLVEKTQQRALVWEQGEHHEDVFRVRTRTAILYLDSIDDDGEPPYRLIISTPEDVDVEEVIMTRAASDPEEAEMNQVVRDLYVTARDQVLGVDDTLEELMEELGIE